MPVKRPSLVPLLVRDRWLLVVLASVAPLYALWAMNDSLGAITDDGPAYLMMARHFSPFLTESPVNAIWAATSRFPPFYPLLLALTHANASLYWVHLLTTSFLLAGLLLYYGWLRGQDVPEAGAALLTLLVALLPGSWLASLQIQSEFLYLLLSLLALWVLDLHRRGPTDERLYAAALAIGVATLTRTIGAALYLPLLLATIKSSRRSAVLAWAAATVPVLLWHWLHQSTQSYLGDVGGIYGHHPWAALVVQAHRELPALQAGLVGNLQILPLLPPTLIDGFGLLCLAAAMWRAGRRKPDALYLLLYFAVVCVWPYPDEAGRFLWTLTPIALAQPPLLLAEASLQNAGPRQTVALTATAILLLAMALPSIGFASIRYRDAAPSAIPVAREYRAWYEPDPAMAMHAVHSELTIMSAMQRIREETPMGQCVIAVRPDLINYFADRPSTWPPLNSVPDPAFQSRLRAIGCRYLFMSSMIDSIYPVALHPLQRVQGMIRVIDHVNVMDPPPGRANVVAALAELQ